MSWRKVRSTVIWSIVYSAMVFASLLMIQFAGAWAETNIPFFQHSSARRIVYAVRTDDSVCWTQEYDKYRPGHIERLDFHLSDDLGNTEVFTPMRAKNVAGNLPSPAGLNTGEPPKTTEETPIGKNIRTSFCTTLPSWAKPDSAITVYGNIGYNGPAILGYPLWTYSVPFPQITFFPNGKPAY